MAGTPQEGIEEILVRGQSQTGFQLESKTSSVTEFSSEDLTALGIEDVADLADYTPNLEIVSPTSTTATFFIRGVGLSDFNANAAGAVAIYQDGVPMNSPPLQVAQIFDMQTVGVLRGPQGSGPGRNASAGAIRMVSNQPDLSGFVGSLRMSQGQFVSDDAPSARLQDWQGAIGMPLVPDVAGARLAFRLVDVEPFVTNRCATDLTYHERPLARKPNGKLIKPKYPTVCGERYSEHLPVGLAERVNNRHNWAARGQVRIVPEWQTDVELLLNGHGSRRDQDGVFGQSVGTGVARKTFGGNDSLGVPPDTDTRVERLALNQGFLDQGLSPAQATARVEEVFSRRFAKDRPLDQEPYVGNYNRVGEQVLDTWGAFADLTVRLDSFEINATSAYDAYHRVDDRDTDMTPDRLFEIESENDAWQFYQDLGFQGELEEEPVSWEAGGFYLMEKIDTHSLTLLPPGQSASPIRDWEQELWSFGVYAGFDWEFLDDFTLKAGARYNYSRKSFSISQVTGPISNEVDGSWTWDAPTGTLEILYRFSDTASAYLKYNHGWKSGQVNPGGLDCFGPSGGQCKVRPVAEPEEIDAFETGFQFTGWEERLLVKASLFHYDYKNYQVFLFADSDVRPPYLEVINASDARVLGAEVEVTLEPLVEVLPPGYDGLRIDLRGGWLESSFQEFQQVVSVQLESGQVVELATDYTGNPLPNSPRFEVSGGAQWSFELGRYGSLTPRYDFTWKADTYFDAAKGRGVQKPAFKQLPEYAVGQAAFVRHNVRLTFRSPDGKAELAGWCRNLTDVRYKTYAADVSSFRQLLLNYVGDPRSCGAEVAFSW
ncbi:MAG: TonB-dependent receptor [Myxococcota bacterium]